MRVGFVMGAALLLIAGLPTGTAAAASPDSITVDPVGAAAAWTPGGSVTFMNGTSMSLVATAESQMPVQLAIAGSCALAGTRVTAKGGSGSCTLAALTRPGNGYAGASNTYRILLAPGWQTAPLAAPASGTIARGTRVKLGQARLVTTAGQPVEWRVTKGRGVCELIRSASGATSVIARRSGACNARASAPGVDGQWNAYAVFRVYTIS